MVEYRALQLNTVMEVVTGAFGGTVDKPASASKARRKRKRANDGQKPDVAARFAALGLPVATVGGDGKPLTR